MKNIIQKVTVGGIVFNQDKVLIVQRSDSDDAYPGLWEIPSGKKEPLENIEDTCVREVKEETGLSVTMIKPVAVFNYIVEKEKETRDCTQICLLTHSPETPQVRLSKEHQAFAWVTKNDLENYNISKETKDALLKAFDEV